MYLGVGHGQKHEALLYTGVEGEIGGGKLASLLGQIALAQDLQGDGSEVASV